jgi:hypothetical protein
VQRAQRAGVGANATFAEREAGKASEKVGLTLVRKDKCFPGTQQIFNE